MELVPVPYSEYDDRLRSLAGVSGRLRLSGERRATTCLGASDSGTVATVGVKVFGLLLSLFNATTL